MGQYNSHNRLQELIIFHSHALQFPRKSMGMKFPHHCVRISFPRHYVGMKFPQNGVGIKIPQTIRRNCILFIILRPAGPCLTVVNPIWPCLSPIDLVWPNLTHLTPLTDLTPLTPLTLWLGNIVTSCQIEMILDIWYWISDTCYLILLCDI